MTREVRGGGRGVKGECPLFVHGRSGSGSGSGMTIAIRPSEGGGRVLSLCMAVVI